MLDHQCVSPVIEVFIPSLMREVDETGKLRKLFRVEILFNGRKHFVLRRYREFQTLHRKLKKILRAPDFPSKRNQHLRTKPLEQRQQELEDYMQVILYQNDVVPQELLDFLQVKHFHSANKNCSSESYDRNTLLDLRYALASPTFYDGCHPPFTCPIADCVIRLPCCISHRRKRRRRRGKRGGVRVRIRRGASASSVQLGPCQRSKDILGRNDLYLARRSWDLRYSCHVHIALHQPQMPVSPAQPRLRVRSGGVNLRNIRALQYSRCPQARPGSRIG
ncbi:Sorting nexin-22 [Anabarilius grahami]|uniref:Sorting nexin-22 n=1 Tax=Anabarilius grahami TaxID=495550 RepID=A0A3N0Z2W2_ANAGA|nr:Sorting nexin-22 [Anabarilius grahami]